MKFKDILELTGWSKKKFGEYFGVDYNTITRWGNQLEPKEYIKELMLYKLLGEGEISRKKYEQFLEEENNKKEG